MASSTLPIGSDPGRSEAGAGGRPAGDCRRAGQGPRRPAAGGPALRGRLPREGLSPARDRHTVRPSRGPVAPLLLCWLRHDRDRRGMAAVRPLDAGVGSAAGAALRSADLPDGSRPARADVPGGRWPGPGDVAPSYLQDRQDPGDDVRSRGARQRRCEGDRRELGFNLHPQLRGRRAAPRGPDRQCRNRVWRTTGFRRCREGHHGHWGADPPRPRRRRQDRGHGADRLHRRLPRAPGILADAGVTAPPMLDWFHIAMRLQHLKQVAGVLSDEDLARGAAKAMIITEVERLRWRIWNGKAKDAQISIDRIHALLPSFESEPARKLRRALDAVDRYLRSQSTHLVDYAERHRAGQRVGTALTEGTANFLVNRRMAKAQQMRWTRRGADLLLQVRCALYNGTLGTGFGQKFLPTNDALPPMAGAA